MGQAFRPWSDHFLSKASLEKHPKTTKLVNNHKVLILYVSHMYHMKERCASENVHMCTARYRANYVYMQHLGERACPCVGGGLEPTVFPLLSARAFIYFKGLLTQRLIEVHID